MPGPKENHDLYVAESLGEIRSKLVTIAERQTTMESKLDSVVAMTNRWKGATAILIILGGLLGYLGNYLMKFAGKA
jgi:hypothetical protein